MVEKNKHDKIGYILSIVVTLIVIAMFGLSLLKQVGKDSDSVTNPPEVEDGIVSVSNDFDKKKIPVGDKFLIIPENFEVSSKIKVISGETFDCQSTSQCDVYYISDGETNKYYFSNQGALSMTGILNENLEPENFTVNGESVNLMIEKSYLYDFDENDNAVKTDSFVISSISGCINSEKTLCFTTDYLPIETTENVIEVEKLENFLNNLRFE